MSLLQLDWNIRQDSVRCSYCDVIIPHSWAVMIPWMGDWDEEVTFVAVCANHVKPIGFVGGVQIET